MVEPSGFRTDWAGSSMDRAEPINAYQRIDQIAQRHAFQQEDNNGSQTSNPASPPRRCSTRSAATIHRSASCSATSPTT